ncbi:MAG: ABC transporter ATP-binding protein [Defluviitaleaceae bacterium]|nr:ABC transporter ATP-binding protein [Defluviitaleaceae bacterium]
MAILQVSNITKTYGKGDAAVTALSGVSFCVEKGEFAAIMGASGSGKSTLMHIIGGVDRPDACDRGGAACLPGGKAACLPGGKAACLPGGKAACLDRGVVIDGIDIFKLDESGLAIFRRRNIGLIYQFYNLIPTLTAEENIMLPRLLDNRRPDEDKLRSILETIGLTDRAKHLPSELSGGQQQRVSIGRALINDPALILADEPTGNLDSKSSREIIDLLKLSNKRFSQTLIVITHDEKIALQADRVITIGDGKILRDEAVRP